MFRQIKRRQMVFGVDGVVVMVAVELAVITIVVVVAIGSFVQKYYQNFIKPKILVKCLVL